MKRILPLFLLLLLLLTGCGDYIEPERRQLITALGIDATPTGLLLTAESLNNGVSAEGNVATRLAYGNGTGMEEALADLENGSFGKVLLSQCPILLIGNQLSATQRQSVWDFCLNGHFISPAVELTACENAADLLKATEHNDRITGYELLELLRRAEWTQGLDHTDHLAQILDRPDHYCLPYTGVQNGDFTITGLSLFLDNRFSQTLSLSDGQWLLALSGRFTGGKIVCDGTLVTVTHVAVGNADGGRLPVCVGVRAMPDDTVKSFIENNLTDLIKRPACRAFLKERQVDELDVIYQPVKP